eukprot:g5127.t1
MAVFLDAGEEVEEDDGAPAPVEEKIKEGEQQGTSKASDEEPLLHEHRPEQAELAARRSKKYLLQVGYRTHWLGDLLYAFWALLPVLLQIFLLVICFCLLDGDRKGMGRWLWLTNRVFNLNFCTREMISMVAEVDNEDHQDLLSTTTDYHFCNARTGPTSGPFHFRNLGLVFLLFWGLFLGVAFLLLSPKLRLRLFFMVPEELRNCDLVVVEEWEEKDSHSSSRGAARKGCTSKDDHLNHSKGSNAGTSTSTTSSGEPHPPTNTDTSKIVARLFANSRYFKTQQVGNYLYIKRLAYSTPASEMTVEDREELDQYFSTVNKTIDSPRFFRFRCVRFLYCPVRNVFVEPENEFLDNGLMTTKDVIEVYRDFLQGGRCSLQREEDDVINETIPGSLSHIGDGDVGGTTTTFNRTSTSKSAVGKKLPNSRFLSTKKYDIHGSNVISVDGNADSLFHFLKLEFLDFATVFQMHCLWAPSIFSNWMLAVINIALCLLFGVINAYNTRNNYKEMQAMACTSGTDLVNVFRYNRRSCGSRTQEGRPGEDVDDEQFKFSGRTTTTPPVGGSLSRRSRGTTTTVTRKLRSSCDSGRGGSPLPEKLRGKLSSRRFSILEEVESFYSPHFDIATTQVAKLVPGDLIEISGDSNSVIPCDCVVLVGSVVVNESNLTGEAMPIQKFALEASNDQMCLHKHGKKNIVYAGTTVMSSSRNGDDRAAAMNNSTNKPPAVAVVLATGAQTAKGQMIRRILYAPDVRFELYDTLPRAVLLYACVTLALLVGTVFGRPEWKQIVIAGFFDSVCAFSRLISPMVRVGFKIAQRNAAGRMN